MRLNEAIYANNIIRSIRRRAKMIAELKSGDGVLNNKENHNSLKRDSCI